MRIWTFRVGDVRGLGLNLRVRNYGLDRVAGA